MGTGQNPSWFRSGGIWRLSLCVVVLWIAFSTLFIGHSLYKIERARKLLARVSKNQTELQPTLRDRLLPLKKMFAEAGEKNKERDKTLNSSSIEVPLTDLREIGNKTQVLLLVIVLTGSKTQERRIAVRETWWRKCIGEVRCVFLTDGLQLEENQKENLLRERNFFGDIFFSPTQNGAVMYGHRFLYLAMWAKAKFNFQYLLRLDDDYFVCMDRLVNELPFRPKTSLSWGWYYCNLNTVRMDEAWSLFSEDVIQKFLAQELRSMLCHPFGTQTIALWKHAIGINNLTEFNDHRLHHTPRAGKMKKFFSMELVCDKYVGVHGSYHDLMHHLWNKSNDGHKTITSIRLLRDTCGVPNVFDVNKPRGVYKHKPKPCIEGFHWGPIPWRSMEN